MSEGPQSRCVRDCGFPALRHPLSLGQALSRPVSASNTRIPQTD